MSRLLDAVSSTWAWLVELPPDFAFLLSLPFLVALTGFLAELGRERREK